MMTDDYYFIWPQPNSIIQFLKKAPEMEQESGTGTRLASVEVTLTIMKTEDTQTHRVHTYSGGYRFRPGLKIHVNKELWTSPRQ